MRYRPPLRAPLLVLVPLLVLGVAGLAGAPAPAAAQGGPGSAEAPLVDQVRVEVVNVDVVVTDDEGRPVTGLTADDFVLYEDGERREVSNFYAFRLGNAHLQRDAETAAERLDWPDSRMRRRVALLFDNNTLERRHRQKVIRDLERFVLEQFDGTYEWAVVAYGKELQLMQPFTSDKTTVLGALGQVGELPVPVRRRRPTDPTFVEGLAGSRGSAAINPGTRGLDRGASKTEVSLADFELRERMLEGLQMFDRTAAAAIQTMRAHMGMEGRKSLILVAGQPAFLPGGDQVLGRGFPGVGSGRDRHDPLVNTLHSQLMERYDALIRVANASGFSIYPISAATGVDADSPHLDVERNVNMISTGYLTATSSNLDLDGSSRTLADNTGGSFYATTNFYGAFDDIDDRTSNSYVLGFTTDHPPEGDYHPIRVEVKRPGLRVLHRQGYLHLSREDRLAEELATPLAFPKDRGDFEVVIELTPGETENRKSNDLLVAGLVPLQQITLLPRGEQLVGRVHVFVALYGPKGDLVSLVREPQDLALPAAAVAGAPEGAPARLGLMLKKVPKGEYTVTITLVDDVTERYGTALQAVQL